MEHGLPDRVVTVSYHLTRLYRAGLLTRLRDTSSVRYQRTGEADRLLAHAM
ncbi:hypothetical protein ACWIG5_05600 [Streptomyces lydicus]